MPWQYECRCEGCNSGAAGFSVKPLPDPFMCHGCGEPMDVVQAEIPKDHPGFDPPGYHF